MNYDNYGLFKLPNNNMNVPLNLFLVQPCEKPDRNSEHNWELFKVEPLRGNPKLFVLQTAVPLCIGITHHQALELLGGFKSAGFYTHFSTKTRIVK